MKRKEMLARLAKGEDPLELSIEKWQDIVDGKGRDYGITNCALCATHFLCDNCPVEDCYDTPYHDYEKATSTKARKEAAKKELEFLESLRKEAEK